jgi:hypothetical protein
MAPRRQAAENKQGDRTRRSRDENIEAKTGAEDFAEFTS